MSTKKDIHTQEIWITQAEAARVRKVSRQAINKLVKAGKLKTLKISSIVFVDKIEIESLNQQSKSKPK